MAPCGQDLPNVVLEKVFKQLDPDDLCRSSETCRFVETIRYPQNAQATCFFLRAIFVPPSRWSKRRTKSADVPCGKLCYHVRLWRDVSSELREGWKEEVEEERGGFSPD